MEHIHASLSATMAELKKNPAGLLARAEGSPVAILTRNKPAAYLIPAEIYEKILEAIENAELLDIAEKRLKNKKKTISVHIDDL